MQKEEPDAAGSLHGLPRACEVVRQLLPWHLHFSVFVDMGDILDSWSCSGWMCIGLLLLPHIRRRLAGAGPTPISSESERLRSNKGFGRSLWGKTHCVCVWTSPRDELDEAIPGSCVCQRLCNSSKIWFVVSLSVGIQVRHRTAKSNKGKETDWCSAANPSSFRKLSRALAKPRLWLNHLSLYSLSQLPCLLNNSNGGGWFKRRLISKSSWSSRWPQKAKSRVENSKYLSESVYVQPYLN